MFSRRSKSLFGSSSFSSKSYQSTVFDAHHNRYTRVLNIVSLLVAIPICVHAAGYLNRKLSIVTSDLNIEKTEQADSRARYAIKTSHLTDIVAESNKLFSSKYWTRSNLFSSKNSENGALERYFFPLNDFSLKQVKFASDMSRDTSFFEVALTRGESSAVVFRFLPGVVSALYEISGGDRVVLSEKELKSSDQEMTFSLDISDSEIVLGLTGDTVISVPVDLVQYDRVSVTTLGGSFSPSEMTIVGERANSVERFFFHR